MIASRTLDDCKPLHVGVSRAMWFLLVVRCTAVRVMVRTAVAGRIRSAGRIAGVAQRRVPVRVGRAAHRFRRAGMGDGLRLRVPARCESGRQ